MFLIPAQIGTYALDGYFSDDRAPAFGVERVPVLAWAYIDAENMLPVTTNGLNNAYPHDVPVLHPDGTVTQPSTTWSSVAEWAPFGERTLRDRDAHARQPAKVVGVLYRDGTYFVRTMTNGMGNLAETERRDLSGPEAAAYAAELAAATDPPLPVEWVAFDVMAGKVPAPVAATEEAGA